MKKYNVTLASAISQTPMMIFSVIIKHRNRVTLFRKVAEIIKETQEDSVTLASAINPAQMTILSVVIKHRNRVALFRKVAEINRGT